MNDLGPSMVSERLWFNLNPASPIDAYKKKWFEDVRFRRAVSLAIDRKNMARVVFGGLASAASGPVSPANHFWRDESIQPMKRDVDRARRLLVDAGFRWEDENLCDRDGNPVRFTIITNAGSDQRRQEGAFIQEDLRELGIETVLAPIEGSALLARITGTFDYDACLLGLTQTDPDPSAEMALWAESRTASFVASGAIAACDRVGSPHRPPHGVPNDFDRRRAPQSVLSRWNSDELFLERATIPRNSNRDRSH